MNALANSMIFEDKVMSKINMISVLRCSLQDVLAVSSGVRVSCESGEKKKHSKNEVFMAGQFEAPRTLKTI